jgi:hypothetical protein
MRLLAGGAFLGHDSLSHSGVTFRCPIIFVGRVFLASHRSNNGGFGGFLRALLKILEFLTRDSDMVNIKFVGECFHMVRIP